MSFRRLLLVLAGVLAILSPSVTSSCVIVNVNGVMDSATARACLRESYRKFRTFPLTDKWSGELEPEKKNPEEKANEVNTPHEPSRTYPPNNANRKAIRDPYARQEKANEVNTPHKPSRTYPPNNANSKALRDPYARQMVCMFVSGFSLAAGLLLFLSWMTLGEKKPRPPVFRAVPAVASSPSCSSSDHDHRRPAGGPANRANESAEDGSSSLENQPFRAQLRPPETAMPQAHSTPSTEVCGNYAPPETVPTNTPNTSAVALSTREFWL